MITKEDFNEVQGHIFESLPSRLHLVTGSWIPDSLRKKLESYLSIKDIDKVIEICADGALEMAGASPYLVETLTQVLRIIDKPPNLRLKIQEALGKANISTQALAKIGIRIEEKE